MSKQVHGQTPVANSASPIASGRVLQVLEDRILNKGVFGAAAIEKVCCNSLPRATLTCFQFLVIVLFGPAQLHEKAIAKHGNSNAKNWEVAEITPNMIAVAATMVRTLFFDVCY